MCMRRWTVRIPSDPPTNKTGFSDYIAFNGRMDGEGWIGENVEKIGRYLFQGTIPSLAWRN
jgi:hypothetical protein